ncbi:MAG: NAD(P)/FAD-dependent oxidoreductase [Planctomycetia bacterium]|nr:NAD(P)/FAD-dependent oxidoreductase [Planctomycetia bacterium]
METCDVLIVGGGPAGSSCAWGLRGTNLDVLVIDRKTFPRDKVCAGWITPQVVEELNIDLEDYRTERVCQPIVGFRTGLVGGREVETHYERPVSYGIRRCEFDWYLLDRCGARRLEGEMIDRIDRVANGWLVNDRIRASLLVGAGGHFCPVARLLGACGIAGSHVVTAQEVEFLATPEDLRCGTVQANVPELFFCADLQGYGWCFRKGNYLNIGLGRTDCDRLSVHVREFIDFLRDSGKVRCEIPARLHGHAYRLYERTQPTLCDDGVLLVGDAAGLAYPQSGEGIRPAVESGLLAAEVIANAEGNYCRQRLEAYRQRVVARLGRPRGRSVSEWLPASWLRMVARQLLASREFSRRIVLERWFLHMHQSALWLSNENVLANR